MNQLERLGLIIKLIANYPGIKLTRLENKLREEGLVVSQKTITTDIQLLKADMMLLPDRPRLREGYFLADIQTIGLEENETVVDALSALGVNLHDHQALLISRRLAKQHTRQFRTGLRQRDIYKVPNADNEIEKKLFLAMTNRQAIKLRIESPRTEKPQVFTTYPLFRVFHERGWYLITRNINKTAYFPCRIDRIKSCEILKKEAINTTFDADLAQAQYFINCGWGMDFPHTIEELQETEASPDIVVRFDQSIAKFIREGINRHPKAKIELASDGTGCLDFHIKLKYHNEFKHWVRSWGSKAWFLAPQSFVDEEKAEVRRKMQIYGI
jgi:predicted DNA-binding transcriptional regulator YafY